MKISSNKYINDEDICMYTLYSREELRRETRYGYIDIRDLFPNPRSYGGGEACVKLINFLKLHHLSLKQTLLFSDIAEEDLALPDDESLSHLSEKEQAGIKKSVRNIERDKFTQKDIDAVLPHGTHFLSNVCFSASVTKEERRELLGSLDEYIQDFVDGDLVISERNALTFERQKDKFFHLILSSKMLEKYGTTFVFENSVGVSSDFFFIHTLLALEKLGYISLNHISFSVNGVSFDIKYQVNLTLNPIFVEEMHRKYQKENPTTLYAEYDTTSSVLSFSEKKIELSKSNDSDAARLMAVISKEVKKRWSKDEIYDEWGYSLEEQAGLPQQKMYQAAVRVQAAVAKKTQVDDFLIFSTKEIHINPKYLAE